MVPWTSVREPFWENVDNPISEFRVLKLVIHLRKVQQSAFSFTTFWYPAVPAGCEKHGNFQRCSSDEQLKHFCDICTSSTGILSFHAITGSRHVCRCGILWSLVSGEVIQLCRTDHVTPGRPASDYPSSSFVVRVFWRCCVWNWSGIFTKLPHFGFFPYILWP